jgi:alkylation response protein AidB-like acyl-CoA dehydrogenase
MTDLHHPALPGSADLLDERMRALDRYCWELAGEFREPGAALDRDPDAIADYLSIPGVAFGQVIFTPPRYRVGDFPAGVVDAGATSLGSVIVLERFAYGDPNVILACPGPSLSGGTVRALADPAQLDRYFGRLAAAPTHTFFGLTEPDKGSAATELSTTLTPAPDGDGWLLNGEKRYIGNGARAQSGVVFARRTPGLWGVEAVLVDTASPGLSAGLLPTLGMRGARISWMRFADVRVPARDLLGAHLRPSRRGLHGALAGLYRFRPGIAAMALGCAQAACDYLCLQRPNLPQQGAARLADLLDRIAAVRRLVYSVAAALDRGVVDPHRIGAVKAQAAHLGEEATSLAVELLGPASLLDHPWLEKTHRDVRAFELMEGTTNLHRLSVFQGLLKNTFLNAPEDFRRSGEVP